MSESISARALLELMQKIIPYEEKGDNKDFVFIGNVIIRGSYARMFVAIVDLCNGAGITPPESIEFIIKAGIGQVTSEMVNKFK